MSNIIILFAAFLGDILLGKFLGQGFVGYGISASSRLLLIALVLTTFKDDQKTIVLSSFFVGFILDLFNIDTFYTYALIFVVVAFIVNLWSTRINDTFVELFFLTLAAIFVKEFLLYLYNVSLNNYILSVEMWAVNHLTYTLFLSLLPIAIGVLLKIRKNEKRIRDQRMSKKSDFIQYGN